MNRRNSAYVAIAVLVAALGVQTTLDGAAAPADDDQAIVHVLNRIGYGPRPGEIDRVRQIGLRQYIDEQLHPERIPDGSLAPRLDRYSTLNLSSRDLSEKYEVPLLQARRSAKQEAASSPNPDQAPSAKDMKRANPDRPQANQPLLELSMQKIVRAAYSERQLQEVLTDFWFNHFNVDARKGPERFMLTEYEREVIRPHVLGHFRDLLGATAKSSAMLFYLDNWMSADPNGPHPAAGQGRFGGNGVPRRPGRGRFPALPRARSQMPPQQQRPKAPKGLNENYGRELLELHTLGVDGGYTQKDVTEVARAFTGWSIANPRMGGGFRFMPQLHDDGEKIVLGHRIKVGRRRARRRRGARYSREPSRDGAIHRHETRATIRERHAAASTRRSSDEHVSRNARRSARRDGDDPDVDGIPVGRCLSCEGQIALRVHCQRRRTTGADDDRRAAARPHDAATRHAVVSVPAANRIQRHRRRAGSIPARW